MREIILFSLPSIAASLLEPLAGVVDTALVGQLDTKLLAALAVGTTLLSSFTWVFNFLIHASTQAIASAGDESLGSRTNVSLSVAGIVSLVTAALLYIFRYQLYDLIGVTDIAYKTIDEYFVTRIYGHPAAIFFMTALSILRGLSKVRLALILVFISTVLNIIFSWLFIYKLQVGLSGAAIGTVAANLIGMILCFIALYKEQRVRHDFFKIPPASQWLSFGKNSLDLFGRSIGITGSLFLAARFAAAQSATALAAHQILLQAWLFVSFFIDGVAITANIKGSALSARNDRESFRHLTNRVLALGSLLGAIFGIFYFVFARFTQEIFTHDMAVIEILDELWPWIALTQVPNALAFVYDGVLFGLGSLGGFKWVRRWMLTGALCVFLPIAYFGESLNYVWAGLIALNLFRLVTGWWSTKYLSARMGSV